MFSGDPWFPLKARSVPVPWFDQLWSIHSYQDHRCRPLHAFGEGSGATWNSVQRKGWSLPQHSAPHSQPHHSLFTIAPAALSLASLASWNNTTTTTTTTITDAAAAASRIWESASTFVTSCLSPTSHTLSEISLTLNHGALRLNLLSPRRGAAPSLAFLNPLSLTSSSSAASSSLAGSPAVFLSNGLEACLTFHHDPQIPSEESPASVTVAEASLHLRHRGRSYAIHGTTFVCDFPLSLNPRSPGRRGGQALTPGLGVGADYIHEVSEAVYIGGALQYLLRVDPDDSLVHSVVASVGGRYLLSKATSITSQVDTHEEVKIQLQQQVGDSSLARLAYYHCPFVAQHQSVVTASMHSATTVSLTPFLDTRFSSVPTKVNLTAGSDGNVSAVVSLSLDPLGMVLCLKGVGDVFSGGWRVGFELSTDIVSYTKLISSLF